jgi:hypothetical protein
LLIYQVVVDINIMINDFPVMVSSIQSGYWFW